MSPRLVPARDDSVRRTDRPLTVTVDGTPVPGVAGQTLAGVLLAAGRTAWRTGRGGAPRGVFCGIGVCFDCLVTVNGERDVRACMRRARDGDAVTTQSRASAAPDAPGSAPDAPGSAPAPTPAPAPAPEQP
ncbi:(2Fe-2S)-binding protein [Streptomyces sp. TS71-3]|uniref:(2Fe-2S)-binding protein n=1 Tax=Streptomyces sp. TS71-3 TaxID=2733862 RepID=UPI001B009E4C|nr:(2Fe-2S)-binding protein [Streptomyces sp. TS71-3]GHJ36808.1 hypothetical protein Sm713_24170 [Streptomyces sp. TS71-3]